MSHKEAAEYVASKLAWDTYRAINILKTVPNLAENTSEITKQNLDAAIALGVEGTYRASCSLLEVQALYVYKAK